MAKIIKIEDGQVFVGTANGELKQYGFEAFSFAPQVGDLVEVFESDDKVIISKTGVTAEAGAKSKVAAGLLGIFLGNFGAHNFYLGNNTKAVIQLLVSIIGGVVTCGVATIAVYIWALVEAILILTSQPGTKWSKDADGNELA
ncbi:MAG: TM2 domain-containing protein [Lactobacillales bacterium]|jgi:TM2 domain-containing membrane protein YozV|nr:TM2 domain-containing protein [Lactobacillales bacterium]